MSTAAVVVVDLRILAPVALEERAELALSLSSLQLWRQRKAQPQLCMLALRSSFHFSRFSCRCVRVPLVGLCSLGKFHPRVSGPSCWTAENWRDSCVQACV